MIKTSKKHLNLNIWIKISHQCIGTKDMILTK